MVYILPGNRARSLMQASRITPPLRGSRRDKGSARSRSGGGPTRRRVSVPRRRWPWLVLLAGSGICCAAILLSPWLVLQGEAAAAPSVGYVFSHLCHQDPQRSLSLAGVFLPVCNRCLSLYLGGLLGVLLAPLARGHAAWLLGRRALLLGPLLLTGLDAGLDLVGAWNSTLWSRVATGGPAGLGLGLYLTLFLESLPRAGPVPDRGNVGQ